MSSRQSLFIALIGILVLGIMSSVFIIDETQRAIKLRFGLIVQDDIKPGLYFKIPVLDTVKIFDGRVLTLDAPTARFLTVGKKFVEVDAFLKWRIKSTKAYYKATSGDRWQTSNILTNLLNDGLRAEFARRSLNEVISGERDQLMDAITLVLNDQIQTQYGIEVLDVRVKGIDLPEELSKNVYRRMTSEREREARETRSEGRELAEGISADADRQKTIIEAQAFKKAETARGEGDAEATAIYAKAFNQDPEFYSFTRSMNAYEETFGNKGDLLVIEQDSDFFRYLKNSKAKK